MAVRNGEDTISKTIESILNQTFKDFEFIIINDASTDSTGKILREYAEKDERIRVITNDTRLERCISRNMAVECSKGQYVAVTDGDDISKPDRLAKKVVYLDQHPECYLVGARAELRDEKGKKIGESWGVGCDADISELLETENRLVHSSVMFRNTKDFWYREKFKYAQDYDLFLQILHEEEEIHLLQDLLVEYSIEKDLKFDDYLVKQTYFAEIAKYLYQEKKENMVDRYEEFDTDNLEQYVPKKIVLEMEMKRSFFSGDFKKARKLVSELMDIDPSAEWRIYYLDTFFKGKLRKMAKPIKRKIMK